MSNLLYRKGEGRGGRGKCLIAVEAISFREEKKLTENPSCKLKMKHSAMTNSKVMTLQLSTVFLGIESVPDNHLLILLNLDFPTQAFESLRVNTLSYILRPP